MDFQVLDWKSETQSLSHLQRCLKAAFNLIRWLTCWRAQSSFKAHHCHSSCYCGQPFTAQTHEGDRVPGWKRVRNNTPRRKKKVCFDYSTCWWKNKPCEHLQHRRVYVTENQVVWDKQGRLGCRSWHARPLAYTLIYSEGRLWESWCASEQVWRLHACKLCRAEDRSINSCMGETERLKHYLWKFIAYNVPLSVFSLLLFTVSKCSHTLRKLFAAMRQVW